MADITKCVGTDCPVKETCYRFTAPVTDFQQSWFCNCPLKDSKCDMYWGENAQSIYSQLQDIIQPNNN